VLVICNSTSASSQAIHQITQNIGGSHLPQTGYSLAYSIGEIFISSDNASLNSGFLESMPSLIIVTNRSTSISSQELSIVPNPIQTSFTLKTNFRQSGELQFQITGVLGNKKYLSPKLDILGTSIYNMNIESYPSGMYFITVIFKNINGLTQLGTYKVVKL
jgi:hypothetical protein